MEMPLVKINRTRIAQLLLICGLIYLLTASGHFNSSDEDDLLTNTRLLAYQYRLVSIPIGEDLIRGPQEIGQSLLALPLYVATNRIVAQLDVSWREYTTRAVMTLFNIGVTLITIAAIYYWLQTLYSPPIALVTAAIYGLTSLAWPYSQTFYREPLAGLGLFTAFWAASRFRQYPRRTDFLAAIGCAGMAILTKSVVVLALPWLLLFFLCLRTRDERSRRNLRVLVPIIILGLTILLFLLAVMPKQETLIAYFQELVYDIRSQAGSWLSLGLVGLLLSPGKGLVVTTPSVLLAALGFVSFYRRYRLEAIAIVGVFLTLTIFYSTRRGWHGGACWGPRYLLPVLPLLMLPVGAALTFLSQPLSSQVPCLRWMFWTICIVGFLVQVAAVSISPLNYYEVLYHRGVISSTSLDGGSAYLHEAYFEARYSPIWGHTRLAAQRALALMHGGLPTARPIPSTAAELNTFFASEETLDFWWLHLLRHTRNGKG